MSSPISVQPWLVPGLLLTSMLYGAPPAPKVNWSPCYRETGYNFECGTVQVPLEHQLPNGAAISIAVVRLPATDPGTKIGSLFFNPGGPGGSGVDFVLGLAPFLYTPEVRARFDIVGFDPRGIARSAPLRCFGNVKQAQGYFTPFVFPLTDEEFEIWKAADRVLIDACDQRASRILQNMSTADVARDLDLLREAVGDEKLNYVGYSYGSYLGNTYANLFPGRVRAIVIDGVLDPIAWSTGEGAEASTVPVSTRLRSDKGAMDTLKEFFRLCDAAGPACAFGPGAATRFENLAQKLKTAPVEVTFPNGVVATVNYSILIANAAGAMYNSASWAPFAAFLASIESAASPLALGAKLNAFWESAGFVTKRGTPEYFNFLEGFPGVICSDSNNPSSYDAWKLQGELADAQFGYFGRYWTWASSACAGMPGPSSTRYSGPFTRNTANPVLVVGTRFDPATRYEGSQMVAGLLPNSALLTVEGWGHTSLFLSQCADEAVSRYLTQGAVPAPGTVCTQDIPPFTAPPLANSSVNDLGRRENRKKALVLTLPGAVTKLVRQ